MKHCISDDLIKLNWKQCQELYCLVLMIFWIKKMIHLPRCHTPYSHYMCIQAQKWKSEKNKIPKPVRTKSNFFPPQIFFPYHSALSNQEYIGRNINFILSILDIAICMTIKQCCTLLLYWCSFMHTTLFLSQKKKGKKPISYSITLAHTQW